ncbi:hypothetical protein HB815_00895 [Listeria booriae]|uniref:hypothetical protein n=1 Tax=Listeria booriae TaxID=1552123 RepID=UPI0016287E16|nr:hypothetical protein [Listeria booriae]MBC1209472.1 hypothetical protein [Listeria booriae]
MDNVELGSVMALSVKAGKEKAPKLKVYTASVPASFATPSIYFPQPSVSGRTASLTSFVNTYTWNVKIFHFDKLDAFNLAEHIKRYFDKKRLIIPVLGEDGEESGYYMRLSKVDIRDGDEYSKVIVFAWDSYDRYEQPDKPLLSEENPLQINGGLKNG